MFKLNLRGLVVAACCLAGATANAASVSPVSYDTINGNTGSYTYWDDTYNGSGSTTTSGAALTGGTGDLTDGVVASQNWFSQPLLYVGWVHVNPIITFNFDKMYAFNSITFFFDDSNGAGGVSQPASVSVNGAVQGVPSNPGSAPFSYTYNLNGLETDTLQTQLFRSNAWVFLSEVKFDGTEVSPVPLPAGGLLLLGGLAGLAGLRRRKRTA